MTATQVRAVDAELAGDAASGDASAYANLYHRHIEAAWRLAQATTASAGTAAAKATTNGFVSVVSLAGRGRDDVADQFRLHLLGAVYREAHRGSDQHLSQDPKESKGKTKGAGTAGKAVAGGAAGRLVVSAFANLPSRWRAALWLQEVEGLPATSAGPILGVSSAAAVQLKKRAQAGLEHRVVQAGGSLPLPDLASTLTATLAPVPAEVQARTEARWKRAVGRERRRAAPVAAWMTQRAPGPLAAAAVGLCAVGIIGLAVVGQGTPASRVRPAGPVASGVPAGGTQSGGSGVFSFTNPAAPDSSGSSGVSGSSSASAVSPSSAAAANQGPHLVATTPTTSAPVVVTVPTTVPAAIVVTVVTDPPVTLPPVTLPPVTLPPVKTPPPVPTPQAAATPVLQVGLNAGIVGVNVGIGPGACTGVQLLNIKLGCTSGAPGLSLGGTLLGGK
jgi:DNA-directed RNA polymerase specialized sigma24 family protein